MARETELDFLVIGAAKAGTTSLFEYLRPHPELYLPAGKEVPFFSDERVYPKGWDEYRRRFFDGAPEDRLWGTVTPPYMAGSLAHPELGAGVDEGSDVRTIPRRIHQLAPDVRLIAVLRDPVERLHSHYRMDVFKERERRPLADVVDELLTPAALEAGRREYTQGTASYVVLGEYGRILAGYYDIFRADQLHVVFTDDLADRPAEILREALEHIGADPDFRPPNLGVRYLAASRSRRLEWLNIERINSSLARNRPLRSAWHAVPRGARWRINRLHKDVSHRLTLWNRKNDAEPEPLDPTVAERLREHFRPDSERLADLIGKDVPWLQPRATGAPVRSDSASANVARVDAR
jgi:hypothetical protein